MARTKNPHAATVKAWESRPRAGSGSSPTQLRSDYQNTSDDYGPSIESAYAPEVRERLAKEQHAEDEKLQARVKIDSEAARIAPRNRDGTLKDEDGDHPPKVGEPFVIYRIGRSGTTTLEGRNGGNAAGVHDFKWTADRAEDFEGPVGEAMRAEIEHGRGDVVHAFIVTLTEPFKNVAPDDWETVAGLDEGVLGMLRGREFTGRVARTKQWSRFGTSVWYAFGKKGYTVRKIGEAPVKLCQRHGISQVFRDTGA